MKRILITGSSGLVGTALCEKFAKEKWNVIGVDSYLRGELLNSKEAETKGQIQSLLEKYQNILQFNLDVRDITWMKKIINEVDAIVHTAAQVSHPRSMEIPIEDAQINIMGTLNLLETTRRMNPDIPFAFLSSNKVYGDYPNHFVYKVVKNDIYRRYENVLFDSFDENLPLDHCGHTPFGVSKTAADLYTQDYAINFGMKTATFRGGCLIGKNQRAVEAHGFLGFFTKQILLEKVLKIYGGDLRVRDNIHSSDVSEIIYQWIKKPKPNQVGNYGTPYNIGGTRINSVSISETIKASEYKIGTSARYATYPERGSDHIWWITNMGRFKRDYPKWKGITKDLDFIFNELINHWISVYDLSDKLQNPTYFKDLRKNQ